MPDDATAQQQPVEPDEPEPPELEPYDFEPDDSDLEGEPDSDYDPAEHMSQEELDDLAREAQEAERDYEADLIRQALRTISKDAAKGYLTKYGDAVDTRIQTCLGQAKRLMATNHPGPALTLAASALEIMIRFLLLRPLVQGAFLSDKWAAILAARVTGGRTAEDREMLPAILREWGLDLNKVRTASGVFVWPFIVDRLWSLRNGFVHRFDPVATDAAAQAVECAEMFRATVVGTVAKRLGFTLDETQRWSAIKKPNGTVDVFEVADLFVDIAKPKKQGQ
ncbi:MAG: hypothetical protein ACE10F_09890 [Candidatus Methylomirabilales bacterium]|nr:hypothetical protein [candidate division NC10 bacterium]